MKVRDLLKLLKENGWYLERQGKGDHEIYKHPEFKYPITIDKGAKDVPKGLLHKILKQARLK